MDQLLLLTRCAISNRLCFHPLFIRAIRVTADMQNARRDPAG